MVSFLSTYVLSWKIFIASWGKDWKTQRKMIEQMDTYFVKIPLISNLMWNILMFLVMQALLISAAGFSKGFPRFSVLAVLLPELVGTVSYYCYKFGASEVLTSLSLSSFWGWVHNWWAMQGIALTGLTHTAFFYFGGILLQPYLLPAACDLSVAFPTDLYEEYLRVAVYYFAAYFAFCVATLPLWKHGYQLSMAAAGRPNVTISYSECFMELFYQSSQGHSIFFTLLPILLILQTYCDFRVYTMHFIFASIEVALINYAVQFKFCITHQMSHQIQPLYAMTHIEHHICKGIYPTTSAVGIWENWANGQSAFFTAQIGIAPIPYLLLQTVYMGANIVVHTMWPSNQLLQWHTLHHTILADVYNVNIPGPYDFEHSKMVPKLNDKLKQVSPFVRYEALSDLAAFGVIALSAVGMHYGLGMGMGHVDWANRLDWQYYGAEVVSRA